MGHLSDKSSDVRRYLYSKQHIPTVRIAVLGCGNVGKRSILRRFCYGSLIEQSRTSTTELEWHKHAAVQGCDVHVQFDMMSDEPSRMSDLDSLDFWRYNEAYMVVYDVTDELSFDVAGHLCEARFRIPREHPWRVPIFIVASKIDRWRGGWAVPLARGEELAKRVGATFLPVSALSGEGTGDEVIVDMVGSVLWSRYQNEMDSLELPRPGTEAEAEADIASTADAATESPLPSSQPPPRPPTIWQRTGPGILRLLHRSGKLLERLRPKQKVHHWTPPTKYPERKDSSVVLEPPPSLPTEQARSRSPTHLRLNRSKSVGFAINKTDTPEPPLPPDTLGDPVKLYRPDNKRRSRTLSLEMALSGEFFPQVRDQTT